jgi:hypothetical protein
MNTDEEMIRPLKTGIAGAILTIAGIVASGPLALLLVEAIQPQHPWTGAESFSRAFHPIQVLPYYAGFLLVGGCVTLMAAIYQIAEAREKTRALISIVLTSAFATLVFFNYITQTTLLPSLARHYVPENGPLISLFSLSNPHSLSWAIEMWGWSFFGAATWVASPVFRKNRVEKIAGGLMVLNGVISVAGAFVTSIDLGWVMTVSGLVSFVLWNVLVVVMSAFLIASMKRRLIHGVS